MISLRERFRMLKLLATAVKSPLVDIHPPDPHPPEWFDGSTAARAIRPPKPPTLAEVWGYRNHGDT